VQRQHRVRRPLLHTAVIAALLSLSAPHAEPWKLDREVDGMKVELREVGSGFPEVRVSTQSALPLTALCDAVWGKGERATGDFKKRVVISETDTERWTYEQIRVPLVSDRDCVMRVNLVELPATGRCVVTFQTGAHKDYPPTTDHERVKLVKGSWLIAPDASGKVKVTYVVYSEPGGAIPPLFARGGQRDAAVSFMKQILQRASR
jgi:hypothetical protein